MALDTTSLTLGEAHGEAVVCLAEGRVAEGLAALDRADAALAALASPDIVDVVNVGLARARALRRAGRLEESLAAADNTAARIDELPSTHDGDRLTVHALLEAGEGLRLAGRYDEAGPLLRRAVDEAIERLGADDDDTGSAWNSLGIWHRYRGDVAEAFAAYDRALTITRLTQGEQTSDVASILHNIASLHQTAGDAAAGEAPARQALAVRDAALGPDAPEVGADAGVLGVVLADLGRFDEAKECYARARRLFEAEGEAGASELAILSGNEAALEHLRGDLDGADAAYARAEVATRRALGDDHPQVAAVLVNRATLAADRGDEALARQLAERCETLLRHLVASDHPHLTAARALLADLPEAEGPGAHLA